MAESFAHKWGQILGDLLEESIREVLQKIASEYNLYLDYKGARKSRPGKKVSWLDRYANVHDLDYVMERGGTETERGQPVAFIESAWRRYTKHSRNKAQEIEGAIMPLAETYSHLHPFLGIILAGEFTKGSIDQLSSRGFNLLYFPYKSVVKACAVAGVDASFEENTPEVEFQRKIKKWSCIGETDIQNIKKKLFELEKEQIYNFVKKLKSSLSRLVISVTIAILHGQPKDTPTIQEAIDYIERYEREKTVSDPVQRYEINVRYNNGDLVHGIFQKKSEATNFLRLFSS